jgi:hypothetical protein
MRKPHIDSMSATAIRYKSDAVKAAEVELLLSVLPQLMSIMAEETQVIDTSNKAGAMPVQQINALLLDNDVESIEDVI